MMEKRSGFTLIEVAVAMLLTAVIVSAVFSLALSVRGGNARTDRRLVADQSARQLTSLLKSYVTADCTLATASMAPGGSWSLTGAMGGELTDSCGSCYALAPGHHVIYNFIPESIGGKPYNGVICYDVNYGGACTPDPTCTNTTVGTPPCQNSYAPGWNYGAFGYAGTYGITMNAGPPSVCVNVSWTESAP